jgi:hypothetical protein
MTPNYLWTFWQIIFLKNYFNILTKTCKTEWLIETNLGRFFFTFSQKNCTPIQKMFAHMAKFRPNLVTLYIRELWHFNARDIANKNTWQTKQNKTAQPWKTATQNKRSAGRSSHPYRGQCYDRLFLPCFLAFLLQNGYWNSQRLNVFYN